VPRSGIAIPAPPEGYEQLFVETWNKPGLNGAAWYSWSGNPGSSPTTTTWDPAMLSTGDGLVITAEPDTVTAGKTRTGGLGRTVPIKAPYIIQVACKRPLLSGLKRNAGISWPNLGTWPADVEIDWAEDGGLSAFGLNYHSNDPTYNAVQTALTSSQSIPVDTSQWGFFTFVNTGTSVSTTWTPLSGPSVTISLTPRYNSPLPHNLDMQIEALASNLLTNPVQFDFDWYQELVPVSSSPTPTPPPPVPAPTNYFGAVYTRNAKGLYVIAGYQDIARPWGAGWHPVG